MSRYITIEADVAPSDVLPELDTQDLLDELKRRKKEPEEPKTNNPYEVRRVIGQLLGLREWYFNDKQKFFERIEELF